MSANWTGPNPTQVTAYDLGTVQGNVDPAALSISQSGEQDWFKFTIGVGGFTSISLNDASGHTQGHLIAPSGSVLDFDANHTVLDSAPAGSVYFLEITGASGQVSPSYTFTISGQGTGTSTPGPGDPRPIQTQRAAFITQLFHDTLNRLPDGTGLDSWVQGLANGSITPAEVAADLINSTEFRTNTIRSLYQSILGRPADQAGLDSWLGFFAAGGTVEQMKAQFYGSDEFFNSVGGSNTALVNAFYAGFLNRTPDATGLQVWVGQLDQGVPRSTVAERIENLSLEGAQLIVTHAYETYLAASRTLSTPIGLPRFKRAFPFWIWTSPCWDRRNTSTTPAAGVYAT